MASKKKKKNSNSYWMKFGGTPRKMNLGGDWTGGRSPQFTMGLDNPMLHELTGRRIGPGYPQYEPGHQRGRSNPERESDYVYRNGGEPKSEFGFNINSGFDPMHPYDTWQTFGATGKNTSSRGSGDYVYANGGDPQTGGYKERQLKKAARLTAKAEKREARTARWQNEALIKLGTGKYARKRAEKAEAKAAAGSRKAYREGKKAGIYKTGGWPKAQFGHRGYTSSPTDYTRDYSGIADRNPNMSQDIGALGDTNALQMIPVAGHALDLIADVIGFKGDVQQNFENTRDAFASQSTLGVLNRENVNKGTLDLSTRTDALGAMAGYQSDKPDMWSDLMPEVAQNVGGYIKGPGGDQLSGLFKGKNTGVIGDAAEVVEEGTVTRYGGNPKAELGLASIRKRPGMGNAGKYPNVKSFAGPHGTYPINSIDRGRSALKLAHHSSNPSAIKSKVYAKYPSLKAKDGGNPNYEQFHDLSQEEYDQAVMEYQQGGMYNQMQQYQTGGQTLPNDWQSEIYEGQTLPDDAVNPKLQKIDYKKEEMSQLEDQLESAKKRYYELDERIPINSNRDAVEKARIEFLNLEQLIAEKKKQRLQTKISRGTGKIPLGPEDMYRYGGMYDQIRQYNPVTPPTEEESKKSKGELFERDLTGFRRYDRVGTEEEQSDKKMTFKKQWEKIKATVESGMEEGTFWGWPVDKWGGGKREYGGTFGEDKIQKGRQEFESGMDLRNLRAFGGANMVGPEVGAAAGITPQLNQQNSIYQGDNFNPYSQNALFEATGMNQSGFAQGGNTNGDYEAEGGEVIMHEPGMPPATTGNLEGIEDNDMLSKLEGSSHETGGEDVSGDGEQYVFSKTLKSESWKMNFAKAAEKIAKNMSKYEKAAETGDQITKSTAEAMLQAWTKKLTDLREEQESAREKKFMEMVNSGAGIEELTESFPDLTEQFMAEQQLQQQAGGQGGGMEQQAAMPANPMGDIDMSSLSQQNQQLVGAKYGLPQKQNGEFEPYDFSQWMKDDASTTTDFSDLYQESGLELGKDYMPNRGEFLDFLTLNAPEAGYESGDELYEPKDYYNILTEQFGADRLSYLKDKGIPTTKPTRDDPNFEQNLAKYRSYNQGLPSGWDENYGSDVGFTDRKYWKSRYNSLMSQDNMTEERANRMVEQEKMQKSNAEAAQLEIDNREIPLTDAQKAEQLIAQNQQQKKNKTLLQDFGTNLLNLSPTLYNFAQGNKKADVEQFVSNRYDSEILKELALLKDNRIADVLDENEESFNMLKYMARQHGDGSSGRYMDTLLRGQNIKTEADAAAYLSKQKLDMTGGKIAAESLYNLGERDRTEGVRVADISAQNEAARQAFTAKGWEGISGYSQLQQKMKASAARDEQLKGLLGQIYPDAEMYMSPDGTMDIEKILKENPELKEIFIKYFED